MDSFLRSAGPECGVDLKVSATQPTVVFREVDAPRLDRLRTAAEQFGGRLELARRYSPL